MSRRGVSITLDANERAILEKIIGRLKYHMPPLIGKKTAQGEDVL